MLEKKIWVGNQKQELIDAINRVLFTQFKKDAKEAHALVESYGFKIDKCDGFFGVQNPETHRTLRLKECNGWRGLWFKETGTGKDLTDKEMYTDRKLNIDVLKFLDTPYNEAWWYVKNRDACEDGSSREAYHPTWDKRDALRRARMNVEDCKRSVKRYKKEIEQHMKEIKWLQEQIEANTRYEYGFENRLNELLEEFGLKKGA